MNTKVPRETGGLLWLEKYVPARSAAQVSPPRRESNFVPFACCEGLSLAELSPSESLSEDAAIRLRKYAAQRFEHYELVTDEDGRPVELGRGAMGVTYKAFDVDLRCPVTLKVISEKYLGDEAARLRFLREARAAASVRHPNVASVFHLGRKGTTTSMRWSLWRGKLSTTSSSAQDRLK